MRGQKCSSLYRTQSGNVSLETVFLRQKWIGLFSPPSTLTQCIGHSRGSREVPFDWNTTALSAFGSSRKGRLGYYLCISLLQLKRGLWAPKDGCESNIYWEINPTSLCFFKKGGGVLTFLYHWKNGTPKQGIQRNSLGSWGGKRGRQVCYVATEDDSGLGVGRPGGGGLGLSNPSSG